MADRHERIIQLAIRAERSAQAAYDRLVIHGCAIERIRDTASKSTLRAMTARYDQLKLLAISARRRANRLATLPTIAA